MSDCIFCNMVNGKTAVDVVYEDDRLLVFKDIYPKADIHLICITKIHIGSLDELDRGHDKLIAHMMRTLPKIAKDQGLHNGFRTIINTGPGGGQEVYHLHLHLLGGSGGLPGLA